MSLHFPPQHEHVATHCPCCGSDALDKSPAVLMPFISDRVFGWAPVDITPEWELNAMKTGTCYAICNSVQCSECTHLFLDIRFDDDEMRRLYNGYREEAYTALRERYEPGYRERNKDLDAGAPYMADVEAFLAPHLPATPRVLDWGGDTGKNTPFKDNNRVLHIYDISNKAALVAGACKVDRATALARQYDLVVCSNVLEHVPYPSDMVQDIVQAMGPETVLYVEVPLEEVVRGTDPLHRKRHWHEHVNFFSERSLSTLLDSCGLDVVARAQRQVAMCGGSPWIFQFACRRK